MNLEDDRFSTTYLIGNAYAESWCGDLVGLSSMAPRVTTDFISTIANILEEFSTTYLIGNTFGLSRGDDIVI